MATNIDVRAGYAKDRFDSTSKRVDEFRNWARQLGAAIAVVIGLELTLVGRVLDLEPPFRPGIARRLPHRIPFGDRDPDRGAVRASQNGLRWPDGRRAGSPVTLARYVLTQRDQETQRMIGAYYARANDRFHALSETLGRRVGVATRIFAWSIVLLLAGVALLVGVAHRAL